MVNDVKFGLAMIRVHSFGSLQCHNESMLNTLLHILPKAKFKMSLKIFSSIHFYFLTFTEKGFNKRFHICILMELEGSKIIITLRLLATIHHKRAR